MLHHPAHTFPIPATAVSEPLCERDDVLLISLCDLARRLLKKDAEATDAACDALKAFENSEPAKPTFAEPDPLNVWSVAGGGEWRTGAQMRDAYRKAKASGQHGRTHLDVFLARVRTVEAHERRLRQLDQETGLSKADRAATQASAKAKAAVEKVSQISAVTLLGLAYKAALLPQWKDTGYGLDDEGEVLAFSIAQDARLLGTGGPAGGNAVRRGARPPRSDVGHLAQI